MNKMLDKGIFYKGKLDKELTVEYTIDDYTNSIPENITNVEKIRNEYISNFQKARQAREHLEKEWKEIDAYLWSDGWKVLKNKSHQRVLKNTNSNVLFQIYSFKYAELIQSHTEEGISITSPRVPEDELDPKGSTQEQLTKLIEYYGKVEQFQKIVQNYWSVMNIDIHNKDVFFDYFVYGTGCSEMYWEKDDDDCRITHIPVSSIYLEPDVTNWRNSRYLVCAQQITLLDLKMKFNLSDNDMKEIAKKLDKNDATYYPSRGFVSDTDKTESESIPFVRYYKPYLDKSNNKQVACYYFVGYNNPILIDADEKIGIETYPFSIVTSYKKSTDVYGQSLFKFLLPKQKELNKLNAIANLRAAQAATPLIIVPENSGVDPRELQMSGAEPGKVITMKGNNKIDVVKLNEIPSDFLGYAQNVTNEMLASASMNSTTMGQLSVTGASSGAVEANNNNALLPNKIQDSEIENYCIDLVNLLIQFITKKVSNTKNLLDVVNKDTSKKYRIITYNPSEYMTMINNLKVTVKVNTQQELEQQRNVILTLFQMAAQFPDLQGAVNQIDVIKAFDLPNKDEKIAEMLLRSQIDYYQLASQIYQMININDQLIVQQQMAQQAAQGASMEGVSDEDLNKWMEENVTPPVDPSILITTIAQMLQQSPANALKNETSIQTGVMEQAQNANSGTLPQ